MLSNLEYFKHSFRSTNLPAETMMPDTEDIPTETISNKNMYENNKEVEVIDEEEWVPEHCGSSVSKSIKLLDISNIKVSQSTEQKHQ